MKYYILLAFFLGLGHVTVTAQSRIEHSLTPKMLQQLQDRVGVSLDQQPILKGQQAKQGRTAVAVTRRLPNRKEHMNNNVNIYEVKASKKKVLTLKPTPTNRLSKAQKQQLISLLKRN